VQNVLPLDAAHAASLLPTHGESVLFIRDHYGDEKLYAAADRAGILIVQSIPLEPDGRLKPAVADAVDRLSGHPSLAGWYVGHLGAAVDDVTTALKACDPAHPVFSKFPVDEAA